MLIIDLSSNNAEPDWKALKAHGVGAVWLKATEGVTWYDPVFASWRKKANAAGLRVGAYHFARPDLHPYAPYAEAGNFVTTVGTLERTALRPVLDFETSSKGKLEKRDMVSWVKKFNFKVKDSLKVNPIFYTYPSFVTSYLSPEKPLGDGLWLASYGRNDGVEHKYFVPAPWKKALSHQYTSNGHVFGAKGRVDLSSFNYDPKQFHQTQGWPPALLAHPWLGLV